MTEPAAKLWSVAERSRRPGTELRRSMVYAHCINLRVPGAAVPRAAAKAGPTQRRGEPQTLEWVPSKSRIPAAKPTALRSTRRLALCPRTPYPRRSAPTTAQSAAGGGARCGWPRSRRSVRACKAWHREALGPMRRSKLKPLHGAAAGRSAAVHYGALMQQKIDRRFRTILRSSAQPARARARDFSIVLNFVKNPK